MKRSMMLFLVMALTLQVTAQDARREIQAVLDAQTSSWNKGNIEGFMKGYWESDSLVFIGKNGPKYGWQTTLANYKKSYPDKEAMGMLEFGILKIELIDETHAFVIGSWKLARKTDEPKGFYTLLFRKIKGEWKIVADHSS